MFRYVIDVAFASHDDLQAGVTASQVHRVFLSLADFDDVAAVEVACAIAHRRAHGDVMPTSADLIDFPVDGPARARCTDSGCHRCAKAQAALDLLA